MHSLIIEATPKFNLAKPPSDKEVFRLKIYKIVNHFVFELLIMFFIILNIITMGMEFDQAPIWYLDILKMVNLFCCSQ